MFSKYDKLWKANDIKLAQSLRELKMLSFLVEQLKPEVILEIGSDRGGSLWWWSNIIDYNLEIISIEPEPKANLNGTIKQGDNFTLIEDESQKIDVVNQVSRILNGSNIDFLFINGNHNSEIASRDLKNYGDMVNKGIIGLHDISHPKLEGLRKLWIDKKEALRKENGYTTIEILSSYPHGKGAKSGTGIIIKGLDSWSLIP